MTDYECGYCGQPASLHRDLRSFAQPTMGCIEVLKVAVARLTRERDEVRKQLDKLEVYDREQHDALRAELDDLEQVRLHEVATRSTTDAAARCLERARQEGAEEMREQIARGLEELGCNLKCQARGQRHPPPPQKHWGDCLANQAEWVRALAVRRG